MAGAPIRQLLSLTNEVFRNGQKDVTLAGTAEPLTSTVTACGEVLIQAKRANTGLIYIGGPGLLNNDTGGVVLMPVAAGGQPLSINISVEDLSKIYVNSTVNGEGVTFLYW